MHGSRQFRMNAVGRAPPSLDAYARSVQPAGDGSTPPALCLVLNTHLTCVPRAVERCKSVFEGRYACPSMHD